MSFWYGFCIGGSLLWILGRAIMFHQTQEEIKKKLMDHTYSWTECYGLREYLRRWFCKHRFY